MCEDVHKQNFNSDEERDERRQLPAGDCDDELVQHGGEQEGGQRGDAFGHANSLKFDVNVPQKELVHRPVPPPGVLRERRAVPPFLIELPISKTRDFRPEIHINFEHEVAHHYQPQEESHEDHVDVRVEESVLWVRLHNWVHQLRSKDVHQHY
eukprot:926003_1